MLTTIASTALLQGLNQRSNEDAWRRFCARYEPMLLAFAQRAGLRDEDARDVVQETLVVFLGSFRDGRYDPQRGRLRSWLQGIVLNKIREARRRLAKQEVQVADPTSSTAFMDRVPDNRKLNDIFEEEWERGIMAECLREVHRHVDARTFRTFELYAVENWPAEKVADHLGISRNTVYVSKTRVLSRLRQLRQEIAEIW